MIHHLATGLPDLGLLKKRVLSNSVGVFKQAPKEEEDEEVHLKVPFCPSSSISFKPIQAMVQSALKEPNPVGAPPLVKRADFKC